MADVNGFAAVAAQAAAAAAAAHDAAQAAGATAGLQTTLGNQTRSLKRPAAAGDQKQRPTARQKKTSQYRGVRWHRVQEKWQAGIQHAGKHYYLGLHEQEQDAANAYNTAKEQIKRGTFKAAAAAAKAARKKPGDANSRSSKYRGVRWQRQQKKWYAGLQFQGKHYYLGFHPTEEEAARAYDKKSRELRGTKALLNLPNDGERRVGEALKTQAKKKQKPRQPRAHLLGGEVDDMPISEYRGVSWCKKANQWKVTLSVGGEKKSLGTFGDQVEAAKFYDQKAAEARGAKATLNFPGITGLEGAGASSIALTAVPVPVGAANPSHEQAVNV